MIAAHKTNIVKSELETDMARVAEHPFDSDRKRMSTVHRMTYQKGALIPCFDLAKKIENTEYILFTKGSIDGLMEICTHIIINNEIVAISEDIKNKILTENRNQASSGKRVLGMAYRFVNEQDLPNIANREKDLVFIGMSCMIDPVRPEAVEAVRMCQNAGVRVVMITGDNPLTAQTIGKELVFMSTN